MKTTVQEIIDACQQLEEAMLASLKADRAYEEAGLAKQSAHYKLNQAKENVRAITFN